MKIKEVNGKRMIEKKFLRFACDDDCEQVFTVSTKQDLIGIFGDYYVNANDPCFEAAADETWQIGLKKWNQITLQHEVEFFDALDDAITPKMIRDAEFILYYNSDEFQIWIGNPEALKQYGGEFSIEKRWIEL